jgi:SagB-type dehydrogenase family enzyme
MSLSADIACDPLAEEAATVIDYARRVYRRADGVDEVVPPGFVPDWDDRPAMFALYDQAGGIQLAGPDGLTDRFARGRAAAGGQTAKLDRGMLSTMLYLVAAPLRRKLELSWNSKQPLTGFTQQEYRRGSASGGGLYPTQIYVVSGGDPLPAGIYRYDPGHHRLIPLRRGDRRAAVVAAAAIDPPASSQCYLVLTSDLWQNCFKYNNFGYHVCTQDVGAMLATIGLVLQAFGVERQIRLRFEDAAVGDLLGTPRDQEIALAIVAIGGEEASAAVGEAAMPASAAPVARPRQRSRRAAIPREILELHEATMLDAAQVPIGPVPRPAVADPDVESFDTAVLDRLPAVLLERRSAWGSMRPVTPVPAAKLYDLLSFMSRHASAQSAVADDAVPGGTIELVLQSLNVQGIPAGAYRWDPSVGSCEALSRSSPHAWQSTYAMLNYNLDDAGCLIFVTGDLDTMLTCHGPRGYRVLNARIGMMAQLAYVAAAALSLDCGVVLGARAQRVKRLLDLSPARDVMLAIYVGGAAAPSELFDFQFLRQSRP